LETKGIRFQSNIITDPTPQARTVLLEAGGVETSGHGGLDARAQDLRVAQAEDTGVVDLGPDGSVTVKNVTGSNLDGNRAFAFLVPDCARTSLDVGCDTVEEGGGEDIQSVVT